MGEIKGFFKEHRWLSNFSDAWVKMDNRWYSSVEHAYQAAKTFDEDLRTQIRNAPTPGQAKKLGKELIPRDDWDEVKEDVMTDLLIQKFCQSEYRELLLATENMYLEETNTWGDVYWGVCNGRGLNRLGEIIMGLREDLQQILGE